jgi:hypothetical protein
VVEKEFLEIAKREMLERKMQNRQGGGLRRNKLLAD